MKYLLWGAVLSVLCVTNALATTVEEKNEKLGAWGRCEGFILHGAPLGWLSEDEGATVIGVIQKSLRKFLSEDMGLSGRALESGLYDYELFVGSVVDGLGHGEPEPGKYRAYTDTCVAEVKTTEAYQTHLAHETAVAEFSFPEENCGGSETPDRYAGFDETRSAQRHNQKLVDCLAASYEDDRQAFKALVLKLGGTYSETAWRVESNGARVRIIFDEFETRRDAITNRIEKIQDMTQEIVDACVAKGECSYN